MNKTSHFIRLSILSLVFWSVSGCNYLIDLGLASPQLIEINQIEQQKNRQRPIRVYGTVAKIVPLINSSAYQLKDSSGLIWIVTDNNLPQLGEQLTVEALPEYQEIMIDNENLSGFYLKEIQQITDNNQTNSVSDHNSVPVNLPKKPLMKKR
jgi:hypothetical protein